MQIALPGTQAEHAFVVTPDMCPHFEEQLIHPVCSTWMVVHNLEYAGRLVVRPLLDEDEEAVGARIHVEHRGPAAIGARVVVTATVTHGTQRRLTCAVRATSGARLIAEGEFLQISLKKDELQRRFDEAAREVTG